jgi:predicted transcriptional regulator
MCRANVEAKDFLWRFCAERKGVQSLVCNPEITNIIVSTMTVYVYIIILNVYI